MPDEPLFRMDGVSKRYGGVVALAEAELSVRQGRIHAVLGENGAGKTTLMETLYGFVEMDEGEIEVGGELVAINTPHRALELGIGMVHQHFMLVPTLTVAENLVLGQEPRRGMRMDRAQASAEVSALGDRTGLVVAPDRLVSDLSVGEAQQVEVLKVLWRGAKLLILDEPTAVLSPPEVKDLWVVLRGLVKQGSTVVLITHKLDEVMEGRALDEIIDALIADDEAGRLAELAA